MRYPINASAGQSPYTQWIYGLVRVWTYLVPLRALKNYRRRR